MQWPNSEAKYILLRYNTILLQLVQWKISDSDCIGAHHPIPLYTEVESASSFLLLLYTALPPLSVMFTHQLD